MELCSPRILQAHLQTATSQSTAQSFVGSTCKANTRQNYFKKNIQPFKYFDDFANTKDLHFFLGTTAQFHKIAPNPFIIIGTFQPKIDFQGKLFNF
jgi:hypothetical protein